MAVVSIIILIAVIAIGFVKKMNVGIIAIAAATLFGVLNGMNSNDIIKGFGSNLFVTLLGITFLCGIAQANGSLELFAKKCVSHIGNRPWLAPIIVWLLGIIVSGVGPGSIPTLGVICAVAIPVAKATGYNPIMMGVIGEIGIFCGRFSPITSDSTVIGGLAAEQGISGYQGPLFLYALITSAIIALVWFFYFGGHRVRASCDGTFQHLPPFSRAQILTLLGFVVAVILTVGLKWNIGLSAFAVMAVLIFLGAVDEKQALRSVPWGVLIMVSGVGILMNIVIKVGGIDLIVDGLTSVMSERTAAPLVGASAGVMSWFSSATGVVYPTMIPTVSGIVEKMGGSVSTTTLISMIAICAAYAGLSPASTGGGLVLATRATDPEYTKEQESKDFVTLFIVSAGSLLMIVIAALLGFYGILG